MKKVKVTPERRVIGECFFCRRDMGKVTSQKGRLVVDPKFGTCLVDTVPSKSFYMVLVPVISRSGRTTGEGKFTMVCSPCVAERELREKAKDREKKGAKS